MARLKEAAERFRPLVVYIVMVVASVIVLTLANYHTNSVSDSKTCESIKRSRADTDLILNQIVDHFTTPGQPPSRGVLYIKDLIAHREPIKC